MSLFANETAEIIEKQFCACTFTVGAKDGALFFGLLGVPRNRRHHRRLEGRLQPELHARDSFAENRHGIRVGRALALPGDMPMGVGGHSKGGNLAEFAALTIDEGGYARIKRVFNHDGPSFLEAPSPRIDEPGIPGEARQNRA